MGLQVGDIVKFRKSDEDICYVIDYIKEDSSYECSGMRLDNDEKIVITRCDLPNRKLTPFEYYRWVSYCAKEAHLIKVCGKGGV